MCPASSGPKLRQTLALASTSKYRAGLLKQIELDFLQLDPGFAETHIDGESAVEMAERLAIGKASAAAAKAQLSNTLVIGCDQVAHLDGQIFNKPGSFQKAFSQLQASSGNWVSFTCGLCLTSGTGELLASCTDTFKIKFRKLTDTQISRYLEREQPFDCAGSIKAEALGITLIERCEGKDINTLYGMPLIDLISMLQDQGIDPIM